MSRLTLPLGRAATLLGLLASACAGSQVAPDGPALAELMLRLAEQGLGSS